MGMDLKPVNDTDWGRYNWAGWTWLIKQLDTWGVDTSEFAGANDGELISEETCLNVADAIEKHLSELSERDQVWLEPHINRWRNSGGYYQL